MKNITLRTRELSKRSFLLTKTSRDCLSHTRALINKSHEAINHTSHTLKETDRLLKLYASKEYFFYNLGIRPKHKQGFALMSKDQLKNVSKKGGKISGESRRENRDIKTLQKKFFGEAMENLQPQVAYQ